MEFVALVNACMLPWKPRGERKIMWGWKGGREGMGDRRDAWSSAVSAPPQERGHPCRTPCGARTAGPLPWESSQDPCG